VDPLSAMEEGVDETVRDLVTGKWRGIAEATKRHR